jgi:uncharacterized protein involved in exopolysaccharide biosynthesis
MQDSLLNSEIEILTSRDLQEKVIASLGIDHLFPLQPASPIQDWPLINTAVKRFETPFLKVLADLGIDHLLPSRRTAPVQDRDLMDEAVKRFGRQLKVEPIKKSNVLRVSFQHHNPAMAAKAVNMLIDLFKDKRLKVLVDPHALTFLQTQVAAYRQQLEESEKRLQDFLQRYPNSSRDQRRGLLLTSREGMSTALKTAQSQIAELETKLVFLQGQIQSIAENTPVSTESAPAVETAKANLLALRLHEQELLNKYKSEHPSVIGVRKAIREAEAFLREASKANRVVIGKNGLYQDVKRDIVQTESELLAQKAKVDVLQRQLGQVDTELRALAAQERELSDLQRDQAMSEQNYQTYLTKLEETRLVDQMDHQKIANVSVVQAATVPVEPVKPRKRLHIAFAALLGAFAAVGLAFFSEYISEGLSTPESAERRLGVRVLVAVPVKRPAQGYAVFVRRYR